jgi:hypothetical protein
MTNDESYIDVLNIQYIFFCLYIKKLLKVYSITTITSFNYYLFGYRVYTVVQIEHNYNGFYILRPILTYLNLFFFLLQHKFVLNHCCIESLFMN